MKWKEVLKAHCGTQKTDEKMLYGGQRKLDLDGDGKLTGKDFKRLGEKRRRRKTLKKNIEEEILEEVEDEGGALGMKNLKDIADKKKLKETLSSMEDRKIIFEHEDGDFYTHKPKREKEKGD